MDAEKAFEEIKEYLAEKGYKIFTPTWKYCKIAPAIVAIRPDPRKWSACMVRIYKQHVQVGWQWPHGDDKDVGKYLEETYGRTIKFRPRLISRFRSDDLSTLPYLITKSEHAELQTLIFDARLS